MPELSGARPCRASSADGGEIAYWDAGRPDGPAIVFLHGFALDHSIWAAQFADPTLAANHRLIALDLRGHGQSLRPSTASGYLDGQLWSTDLQAVLDTAMVDRAVLVAWSFGGRAANDYVRHQGCGRLAGICYIAAASLVDPSAVGPAHACLEGLCSSDPGIEKDAAGQFLSDVMRLVPNSSAYLDAARVLTMTVPAARTMLRRRALDYDDLFPRLDLPAWVVHGVDDSAVLPALSTRLAASIPGAKLSLFAHAGHAPFVEQPRRFNEQLASFAARCRTVNARH